MTARSRIRRPFAHRASGNRAADTSAFARDTLTDSNSDGIPDSIASAAYDEDYVLDPLGNFAADPATEAGRAYNARNQLVDTDTGDTLGGSAAYDANGNLAFDPVTGRHNAYDAWSRLVAVYADDSGQRGDLILTYANDALGRRIARTPADAENDPPTDLYYSAQWQVVQEDTAAGPLAQYVWSPTYVDELILRDRSAATESAGDLDATFNNGQALELDVGCPLRQPHFHAAWPRHGGCIGAFGVGTAPGLGARPAVIVAGRRGWPAWWMRAGFVGVVRAQAVWIRRGGCSARPTAAGRSGLRAWCVRGA